MRQETEFEVKLSPLRVWGMLADLRSYRYWHPRYVFGSDASLEASIDFSFLLFGERRVKSDVIITDLDKPREIGWQLKVSELLACFEEHYVVYPDGTGSRVCHSMEWRGITQIFFVRASNKLMNFLEAYDAAFCAYARRATRSGPTPNRHVRRSTLATQSRRAAND
ncbi:MAG: hypothetical protein ABS86_02390 [Sphingobium sp. SCN 64-10]|nr:hypothetical protein [Sphingomonadales bacterium]ODT91590.1 MAG: hypothetical protein ABS86_02390 [Sphingobium sp. SCN 64-10]